MQSSSRLNQLYEQKFAKLKEQKDVSNKMKEILANPTGLIDSSFKTRKSLKAAIAVARQPGYFEYFTPPTEVEEHEQNKTLSQMARQVQKLHRELEEINSEISTIESSNKTASIDSNGGPSSLSQWFDTYGRPKHAETQEDMLTSFHQSPKIYGGTSHHRAFKSQSSNMKKGRLTR
ncbi:unnamed protein product [Ectocarpus fasciculatus]